MLFVCFIWGLGFGCFDCPDFAAKAPLQSNVVERGGSFTVNIISLGRGLYGDKIFLNLLLTRRCECCLLVLFGVWALWLF